MIKCKGGNKSKCQLFDKKGEKALSKPNISYKAALKRERQVQYFKNKK